MTVFSKIFSKFSKHKEDSYVFSDFKPKWRGTPVSGAPSYSYVLGGHLWAPYSHMDHHENPYLLTLIKPPETLI
jgi:hypothetical protein